MDLVALYETLHRMTEQAKRVVARAPIEIRVEYQHLNALIPDYTKNLSKGGAFIETSEPLAVGTRCYFTLEIPSFDEPLRLEAEVKASRPGGRRARHGNRVFVFQSGGVGCFSHGLG